MGLMNCFGGFVDDKSQAKVAIISSSIRPTDPTVLDVVYKVTSAKPTVKVRVLAFEDGERSFAKIVRPETFVKDADGHETAPNVGDTVAANVEHRIAWKVSNDWATRLAKVKFEVLAMEDDLLPLELCTIPASEQYGAVQFSWNRATERQIFDALMWLYSDKDEGLELGGGCLWLHDSRAGGYVGWFDVVDLLNDDDSRSAVYARSSAYAKAADYVYRKMGFDGVLSAALLEYVNAETRLGLSPKGVRQYAYRFIGE